MDWLGYFVPRFAHRKPLFESLAPPQQDDLAQLEELRLGGSKLKLPHPVRAFLDFPDEAKARLAMDMLMKDGYKVQLRMQAADSWVVTAITTLVPTVGTVTRLREVMKGIAGAFDGDYTGWGAPPVY
jgi:hypothetical protein